jgi:hypothetical protein
MIRPAVVCVLMAVAGGSVASAEEYALKFQTIRAGQVMGFPGGYGSYGQLRLAKPAGVKKEPTAVSRRPLYGELRETAGGKGLVFRLDESKGDGKGHDRLLIDMNGNGDLTDETVASPVDLGGERKPANPRAVEPLLFGPIEAPPSMAVAGSRPVYFAQVYVNKLPAARAGQDMQNFYAGQLRFKAGWYLETTVELAGLKQKVGVFDGDGNFRLGDAAEPQTYTSGTENSWYFQGGDSYLVDTDGSGHFEGDPFGTEASPFAPMLYLGAKPFRVTLEAGGTALRVTPWAEDVALVEIKPKGNQVRSVSLAWEHPAGKWQVIKAISRDGKVQVPAGNYRLYGCELLGNAGSKDQVMVSASQRVVKKPFKFESGKGNTLVCGAPLEITVNAEKKIPQSWELPANSPAKSVVDSDYVLRINGQIIGAAGEVYSTFGKGERFGDDPPNPVFTVADAAGGKRGTGNLEFG